MSVDTRTFFTCSHCHKEFFNANSQKTTVEEFKKWYPSADITKAKKVCHTCYDIYLRVMNDKKMDDTWRQYCMDD